MRITKKEFFELPAIALAEKLLGKLLCRKFSNGEILKKRITDAEAYDGFSEPDSASHAFKGKTKRNAPMFECGGTIYVYLCYGLFNILNIISGSEGNPQGVMIRGVEGADGPGRVSRLMKIERSFSGSNITENDELWLEDDGFIAVEIERLPRVGIAYASKTDQERLARLRINI